jgi:hypothetical protein
MKSPRPEILDAGRIEWNHLRTDVLCLFENNSTGRALATTDRCRRNNDQAAGDGRPAGQQIAGAFSVVTNSAGRFLVRAPHGLPD